MFLLSSADYFQNELFQNVYHEPLNIYTKKKLKGNGLYFPYTLHQNCNVYSFLNKTICGTLKLLNNPEITLIEN